MALQGIGDPLLGLLSLALSLQLARVQGLADANVHRTKMQAESVWRQRRFGAADEDGDHRHAVVVQQQADARAERLKLARARDPAFGELDQTFLFLEHGRGEREAADHASSRVDR